MYHKEARNTVRINVTHFFPLEGTLLASLAVCTEASADAASGVALRISHMSCWHSLFRRLYNETLHENEEKFSTKK
jgi:hypothetical protein